MSMLERKLVRDLVRLKGQVATIAIVLACGIMAMVMLRSTYGSLLEARDAYYADYRFGDVFARVQRAPDAIALRLEAIPGVARAYPRVVEDVMVPLADDPDPVAGRIVSIPDIGEPPLCALYLRAGRLPQAGTKDEIVILEQFATARNIGPGDALPVVMNGRLRNLRVVGIALSPEYVLALSGRDAVADVSRFVVMWMPRSAVAPPFLMDGAFNDVVVQLAPGASEPAVLAAVDAELARYGGFHAVGRDKQMSNYALSGELEQLASLALILPIIFLAVAAFLVNVVVSRLVFLERVQIAVLKALGFTNGRIARHYLGLVALIVGIAAVLGLAAGAWSGAWMSGIYAAFYRFPKPAHHLSFALAAGTVAIGLVAAIAGALGAVLRVARMPPAEAMRPPTPLSYRRSLLERLGLSSLIGASATMVVREIVRRPVRFLFSTVGIAMGVSIVIMGRFSWDSFDRVFDDQFVREQQEDLIVGLDRARPARAVRELAHIPGVLTAEGQRMVPVRFRAGARYRDSALFGMPDPPVLRHLLDHGEVLVTPPTDGVLMTDQLAEDLGLAVGDPVDVEILEGDWATRTLVVSGLIDETFGLQAYARSEWLDRFVRSEPRVTTVLLEVEADRADDVRARLKELPAVVGVTSTQRIIDNYRKQTGETMLTITIILTLSAAAIAVGVVYNNARIALSMRGRDLATLRVLGFTRREISSVLLGELGVQVLLGVPLGLYLGYWLARMFAAAVDPEFMRFPLYIAPRTYALAAAVALIAGVISALLVRRKLDRLDLVAVLKASE
ncbi:MAG: ABC transporter permease [Deltaproteobacteria bacterium]|nr:ABC transporter permease [Deltaproteobacteria bacterium]